MKYISIISIQKALLFSIINYKFSQHCRLYAAKLLALVIVKKIFLRC